MATFDAPIVSVAAASSSSSAGAAVVDDAFEDGCSICLDPFTTQDPATVTCCKHEYHLQCILEWSQRSKECPICWQLLVLKDLACQELLAAVENERRLRSRNISPAASTDFPLFHDDFDGEQDSFSDDSDFDELIVQHLAAAATSRATYLRRRERRRSSGHRPSEVLVFSSSTNVPSDQEAYNSPEGGQSLSSGSSGSISPTAVIPSEHQNVIPPVENVVCSSAGNRESPFKSRVFFRQPPIDTPQGLDSSEPSFSDSIKSKWFAVSSRYKESISKSTQDIKEKLVARNNSVKELSKEVQREMSAGFAGVARMIERLDLTPKRTGASTPFSFLSGGTSGFKFKGKDVQDNVIAQALHQKCEEIPHDTSLDASLHVSGTVTGQLEVPHTQVWNPSKVP